MSSESDIIAFARQFINDPKARTAERKKLIRDAIYKKTGRKLDNSCSTCYIEAIFTILKTKRMANYELRKGYVAQFFGTGYKGVKAFTNLNLQTDPQKYDPVAAEYLRLYPERAKFFVRIPPVAPPVKKLAEKPKPVEKPAPENVSFTPADTMSVTITSLTGAKPKSRTRKKTTKKTT